MVKKWAGRLWRVLLERPHLPIVVFLAVAGILTLASHTAVPNTVGSEVSHQFGRTWAIAVALGGIMATVGCLVAARRTETIGLIFVVYGATVYGVVLSIAEWPSATLVVLVAAAIVSMSLIRIRVVTLARRAEHISSIVRRENHDE